MNGFWNGFEKRAAEQPSVITAWLSEASEAEEHAKNNREDDRRIDPRVLSEGVADAWHRDWQ